MPHPDAAVTRGRRGYWSAVSNAAGSVLLVFALLAGIANRQVLDGDRFADHFNEVRQDPAVAAQIGESVTRAVLQRAPDLVAVRPLIEAAATALASSDALSPIVRAAARQVHQAFTSDEAGNVVLRLADVGAVLAGTLAALAPEAAARIPPDLSVTLAQVGGQTYAARTIHLAYLMERAAWLLPLLALLAYGVAIWLGRDRVRATAAVGWGVVVAGISVGAAAVITQMAVSALDTHSSLRAALTAATWNTLALPVWRAAAVAVFAGAILVAAASARLPQLEPAVVISEAWAVVLRWPQQRWARLAHGVALIVVGLTAVAWPLVVLAALAGLVAVLLIVAGLGEIAAVAGARGVAAASATHSPHPAAKVRGPRGRARIRRTGTGVRVVAVVAGAALLIALLAPGMVASQAAVSPVASSQGAACNGHVELCDRRYDDVAFVGAHNAMAAADEPGWFLPEQPTGLVGALEAGVRTLLIDSWYGQGTANPGVVATAAQNFDNARAQTEALYGADVLESALRIRAALAGAAAGPVRPYLCHGLCESGSTQWAPVMTQVRAWVAAHPREVLTLFVEDNVSAADTATVFQQAGLLPYVHAQQSGRPWPTLGQMIDSGRRVVVLMEREGGGTVYPWLLQGFDWVQDTPFSNPTAADLSCQLNRGVADNSVFLVNYWLSDFRALVTNARTINTYDALSTYLDRCRAERGQIPNYVAVNYFDQGDVFKAVDHLNGFD